MNKYLLLVALAACGPPVQGTWEALNVRIGDGSVDLTQEFTDKTISSKAVSYRGSTAYFTTVFSGTYTWENKSDGTHVLTSYSSASITGPDGAITPLDTVCTQKGNCEGYQFKPSQALDTTSCVCKKQELVFKGEDGGLKSTYEDIEVLYKHPNK